MATYVTQFRSTDTGAKSIDGNVGSLVNVFDSTLVIHSVFSTANDSAFNDNTTEARLNAGTAFTLWPTPGTSDRTYVGMQVPWTRLVVDVATASSGQTTIFEYWNGSAWTTLSVTDGTSGFTVDGSITWTAPGNWATTSVNSVTLYWIRVRFSGSAPGTNPTINSLSYLGWLVYFSGTNQRDYRMGAGTGCYLSVNDNGPNGTALGKEADVRGYVAMTALATGTDPFPTAAQVSTGITWRKSTATGATTRTWVLIADDRGMFLGVLTGDTAGRYYEAYFSDLSPTLPGDAYACLLVGAASENSSASRNFGALSRNINDGALAGHYMPRTYLGTGTAIQVAKHGDWSMGNAGSGFTGGWAGGVPYPNGPDASLYLARVWVGEYSSLHRRGKIRGIYQFCHAISNYTDLDTLAGTGEYAGKTFVLLKTGSDATSGYVIETTDGWGT